MEINSSKKHERQRLTAIAYSTLALFLVAICSLTLPYLYSMRGEQTPHMPDSAAVILVIVTVPLLLNGVQLLSGIVLLCLTRPASDDSTDQRQRQHYLPNCKLWVAISRYLNVFIFIEMFITFQFFKAMILPFGIQYLVRLIAMKKTGRFMEQDIVKNLRNAMAREVASGVRPSSAFPHAPVPTPVMLGNRLIATTIVPNNEIVYVTSQGQTTNTNMSTPDRDRLDFDHENCRRLTTFGRLAGQANAIHVHPFSIGNRPPRGRVLVFDDISGELHLQCQRHERPHARVRVPSTLATTTPDGDEDADELPPPSYAEAVPNPDHPHPQEEQAHIPSLSQNTRPGQVRPCSGGGGGGFPDAPPSYNEAVKSRARLHWRIIAMHRKNQRNRTAARQQQSLDSGCESESGSGPQSPCPFPPSSFQ